MFTGLGRYPVITKSRLISKFSRIYLRLWLIFSVRATRLWQGSGIISSTLFLLLKAYLSCGTFSFPTKSLGLKKLSCKAFTDLVSGKGRVLSPKCERARKKHWRMKWNMFRWRPAPRLCRNKNGSISKNYNKFIEMEWINKRNCKNCNMNGNKSFRLSTWKNLSLKYDFYTKNHKLWCFSKYPESKYLPSIATTAELHDFWNL